MNLLHAIFLGFLQGITEFLPISSLGLVILFENILKIENATGLLFEILLHIGSSIAIIVVFRNDLIRIYKEFINMVPDIIYNIKTCFYNRLHEQSENEYHKLMNNTYQQLAGMLLVSIVSCAVVGYLLMGLSSTMSTSLLAVGLNFLVTAVLLLVVDLWGYGTKVPKDITIIQAILIGVCHSFGVMPGISSLGITITVCLLCGFRKNFAVRYAFLLSIPTSVGAIIFELKEFMAPQMSLPLGAMYFAGMLISALTALLCARVMLNIVTKKRVRIFAISSMVIGIAAIVYYYM